MSLTVFRHDMVQPSFIPSSTINSSVLPLPWASSWTDTRTNDNTYLTPNKPHNTLRQLHLFHSPLRGLVKLPRRLLEMIAVCEYGRGGLACVYGGWLGIPSNLKTNHLIGLSQGLYTLPNNRLFALSASVIAFSESFVVLLYLSWKSACTDIDCLK